MVNLFIRMDGGGVVSPQLFTNIRIGKLGDIPKKIDRDLTWLHDLFAAIVADKVFHGDIKELRDRL
jgi:hypothetical protein